MPKKIAIVTGASSGLGREFVLQLLKKEKYLDEIWVIARRRERLSELHDLAKSRQARANVRPVPLDLTKADSFEAIREMLQSEQPDVKFLINAAGFGKIGSWRDISIEDCNSMIDLNCKAAVDMTQLALPFMGKGASILQICSTAGFQPFPYISVYAASKSFLYRYSRALRVELFSSGISVTAVCPYWIKDTEFISTAQKTKNCKYIRHFPLASTEKSVARLAFNDTKLGLAVSTPGIVCSIHRVAAKFIPSEIMMGFWALLRRL